MKSPKDHNFKVTNNSRRFLAIFLLLIITASNPVAAAPITLTGAISSLQATDPALPSGVANPKGIIGYILATIFGNSGSSL